MGQPNCYSAYGLRLVSNLPLPWLTSLPPLQSPAAQPQIDCHFTPFRTPALECSEQTDIIYESSTLRISLSRERGWFSFGYADGTSFSLDREASQMLASWTHPNTIEDMVTYLTGPVLGLALRLRGLLALHASGVVAGGRVLALVGRAGAGKSTTAAAFALSGYRVITEDLMAIRETAERIEVMPGYPAIRLWSRSVEMLCGASDVLPLMTPNWSKRYLDLAGGREMFEPEPRPLGGIYILGPREADRQQPAIEPIAGAKAMMALTGHTYGNYVSTPAIKAREFSSLGRLVSRTPVRMVTPSADPDRLPDLCDMLLEDFAAITRDE